ncbi:MAG: sulfite exporter TauE/SafE family protein [Myxococcota bacterium]
MTGDSLTLLMTLAASLVGFMVSSTTGVGAALVLVPVLSHTLGARVAVAVMAPVLLCNSAIKLWVFRSHVEPRAARLALWGGVPGALLGALLTSSVPEGALRTTVALIILAYVAHGLWRGERALQLGPRGMVATSFATGVASGLSSAGGPTNAMVLQSYGLVKEAFIATGALVSVVLQVVKLPVYMGSGLLGWQHAPLVGLLAVSAAVAAMVGRNALQHLSERGFRRSLQLVLLVLAVSMLW